MSEHTFPQEINYATEAALEKAIPQLENHEVVAAQISPVQNEHIMTIPNGMTAFRAGMAVALPIMIAKGNKYAPLVAGVAAASDKESTVADLIDKRFPGWGRSELGARIDPIADTVFGAGMGAGILASPTTSASAKIAAGISAVKVAKQTAWAVQADRKHREIFGEPYVAKVDLVGKVATAAMLASGSLATLTGNLNPSSSIQNKVRRMAGGAAVVTAAAGLALGETARRQHNKKLQAKFAAHTNS